jgi:hypothetical protein
MINDTTFEMATLRFDGERFAGHALDVECTQELIAYRNLVLECAKSLWRAKYPNRVNLPKGFEKGFRLQFDRLEDGSARVPLQRVRIAGEQGELELTDEFDEAVALIDQAISAANDDDLLPARLPANVIPMFRDFGKTLRDEEVLFTRARGANTEAPYTAKARKRLAEWVDATYEDVIDVAGEVRMANVGSGRFALQVEAGNNLYLVEGKYSAADEAKVLDALHEHRTARLRVRGVGEFGTSDRILKRFARVDAVDLDVPGDADYDDSAQPIWEQLIAIGRSAPEGAWDSVPSDLSVRIDEVVYGGGADRS